MKKYIAPELEISKFEAMDIVTLSVAPTAAAFTEEANGAIEYTSDYTQG